MLIIKFKVMSSVFLYFICNFIIVFSNDIKSDYNIRKRNSQERQKGLCDLSNQHVSFNFNDLYKKDGYTVTSGDKIFYLNICGHAPECGGNVAVCYKHKNNTQRIESIGRLSDISFAFEEIRYKINKKKKLKITFICDRHINEPNITYDKIANFHFKFRSPKACFPKPTECLFKDDHYTYDVSSLHRNNNNWEVQNVRNDYKIYLNMCGNFNSISNLKTNSDCFYNGTQICLVYNNGGSKNLGVFSDSMYIHDDNLLLTIKGGSLCENGSNTITTNIKLICSLNESGPIFISNSNSNCEYNIKWMTPKACPHIIDETSNCILKPPLFESGKMHFETNIIQLNASHYIKYNTCDRFQCNQNQDALFCLINHKNNQQTVIGNFKDDNKLISYDGLLRTTYYGDKCASHNNNDTENRVNIEFNCDYTKNKKADIKMSKDGCTTNITIHTNEVCRDHKPNIQHEQLCSTDFNLSALTLTDRNYEIRDASNPNIVYILNVCQPILYRPATYCEPTAIICMRNDSIANIYKKYKTLGHYSSSKLTVAQNQSLLIQFEGGLEPLSGNHYFTSIEFICDSETKNTLPILVRNTDFEYNFKWVTRYACPFTNNTTSNVDTRKNETKDNRIYKDISENVKKSSKNMNIEVTTSTSRKDIIHHDDLDLVKIMSTESPKIVVTSTMKPKPKLTSLIVPIDIKVSNTSGLYVKNCTIQDFNMNHLPRNINISSKTGQLYSLDICNLKKSQDCQFGNCLSNLKKDASNKLIEMDFYGKTKCLHGSGYFNSVIYLKCTEESPQLSILKEETCSVELEWKHSAACALLEENPKPKPINEIESPKSGHMATILSSVFALLLILCISVFTSIYFWRKRQEHNSPSL